MRKLVFILLALTALLLSAYTGYRGYKVWKQGHMLRLAREFQAKSDDRNAVLSLRQVIASNPGNIEALRLMAELAEKSRSRESIELRDRIVELAPASIDDGLALARTAILLKDFTTASNALERLPEPARKTANYFKFRAAVATASGQLSLAEEHWLEASRLEPTNRIPQLNVAALRVRQTNLQVQAQARATLTDLSNDPQLSCQALRELVSDAGRNNQTNEALVLVHRLVGQTNSSFADKLLELELLRLTKSPEFQPRLAALRVEAAADTAKTQELAMWQMLRIGAAEALAWMGTLDAERQTNQPVALLSADCRNALRDWRGLQTTLEPQHWGELEFMRHAFLARALRGQDLATASKVEWELAVKNAKGRRQSLLTLLDLTSKWTFASEQEQLLWTFVNQFPAEKWASEALMRLLYARGRTQGLMILFTQLAKANPADLGTKNNLALTALLLDANELKPQDLAREVYNKDPSNASFASTFAFSLYKDGNYEEALNVMKQISPQELTNASYAAYYAVMLQKVGKNEDVRKYADLAAKGPLLPEERKLLEKIRLN